MSNRIFLIYSLLVILVSCSSPKQQPLFELMKSEQTGLQFTNKLTATPAFNMFNYMYFYNGAGVGAGDFNNDGLIDLFFASNQAQNKLFINKGSLQFTNVTKEAAIPNDGGWSTGVSVVDINNDGLLDIYVCRVGQYEVLKGKNQLLICKEIKSGVPVYEDQATAYGLDFSGFSTQAAFFDYDLDGDLDIYLMNHSVHHNGTFAARANFLNTYHPLSGDRFYKNEKGKYIDVTKETGINSSAIGYGLGICVSDINKDGWPDLYIGNDFHENDYLYINQQNGTFKEELNERMMHTSQFSMGVDIADINNDALPEIISMDMLPQDPYILKRSLGEDEYETFNMKLRYGYNYQYARNALQLNRGNGMFSEVGLYAGVYATDWSWAPLWLDFDNDGLKDLFVSNGIPKRLNDIDYVNYVGDAEIQQKIREGKLGEQEMTVIDKFPQIKLPNKFYRNKGEVQFSDEAPLIKNDEPTFSNGAVYADLDNDGDLDIVVNNIDDAVMLYKNTSNDNQQQQYLSLELKGDSVNHNALGASVLVYDSAGNIHAFEKQPVRGFQSSMEIPMHIGLQKVKADSVILIWPDRTYEKLIVTGKKIKTQYRKGLPQFDYLKFNASAWKKQLQFTDITQASGLEFLHHENEFNEFNREYLLPHMLTTEGPALATGDVNMDGLEDVFIGSSKTYKPTLFLQTDEGKFIKTVQPQLEADSMFEITDAVIVDVNNDSSNDLILASGGNEYYGKNKYEQTRVFLNDGKANFSLIDNAVNNIYVTAGTIATADFTGDGFVDLFIGGRTVPWAYGETPRSYLLANDKTGKFKDVTAQYSKELQTIGMVTGASWTDMDKDGDADLLLSLQWDGLVTFINNKGSFSKRKLTDKKGWWNFALPVDIDNDGDIDIVAGNLGLNSRLKATSAEPVKMYYNDFDENGKKEQVLTYFLNGKEIPFANKAELEKQLPFLKKKFLYADDFAKAKLGDIFSKSMLSNAVTYSADCFESAVFINDGQLNFAMKPFPWKAQLTTYRSAVVLDANGDKLPDLLLGGNFRENNIQMGRYDADYGTVLLNKGKGEFEAAYPNIVIKGQIRKIKSIQVNKQQAFLLARNNDSLMLIKQ
ncbi:VCBS repeat-containing protein [Lacibacter sp. H375]|uniref:VCBS repeat-containing protein n=1 Tax=Lacibacter sp. H375 TaxID=3133424 RepID=UPI0030BE7AD1